MTTNQIISAESAFYAWACEEISNTEFKNTLALHGLVTDLRQADLTNQLECTDILTGEYLTITC